MNKCQIKMKILTEYNKLISENRETSLIFNQVLVDIVKKSLEIIY